MNKVKFMNKLINYLLLSSIFIIIYNPVTLARPSLSEIESRVIELENKLYNNLNLEMANKLDALQLEIQELRGIIEEQQNLLSKINADLIKQSIKQEKDPKLDPNLNHNLEYILENNENSNVDANLENVEIKNRNLGVNQSINNKDKVKDKKNDDKNYKNNKKDRNKY